MPLYDCVCLSCGSVQEQLLKRAEDPTGCLECLSEMERKVAQLASFSLKGGGWYQDGYSKGKGASD